MSFRVNRNLGPFTSGAQSMFAMKQWLCTSHPGTKHWAVEASGDGLSAYNPSGDVILSSGSGANGLDNNYAWFILRDPDSVRRLLFWRSIVHYQWYWWYKRDGAFDLRKDDGNPCDANDPPGAVYNPGRKTFMNNRTAGPINVFPNGYSWYTHICCEGDTPEGTVYPFWMISRYSGTGVSAGAFIMDCVVDALSPAGDDDKAILLGTAGALSAVGSYLSYNSSSGFFSGYMRYGESNEEWAQFAMPYYYDANGFIIPDSYGAHPEDGKYPVLPSFYWRYGGTAGVKGQSHMLRWRPSSGMAAFGDTLYDGTEYYLIADQLLLRGWPDSTGPLV